MTGWDVRRGPPSGTVPVVVPADVAVTGAAGVAMWASAVTVYPEGFAFTLLLISDTRRAAPLTGWALDVAGRERMCWLEVRFADGRARGADLNANTPRRQPSGPHVKMLDASGSDQVDESRWWVTPLPPPGPVEVAVHLNGSAAPSGVGLLDGAVLVSAASRAQTVWLERSRK